MEEQQIIVAHHLHLENDNNPSYYEELLEDLQQMEINCCFPKLKDKMKTLNCEVRYIMPFVKCNCVPRHKAYQETKRRFRIEGCPERLIEFVEHMIVQALLITPDATDFYQGIYEGDINWGAFTDCVLDNLKYAQRLDDNKDVAKSIEESLRFVRNFVMLVEKRNFMRLNNNIAKKHDFCKTMVSSISQDAALIFHLFMAEKLDEPNDAMNSKISKVQKMSNRAFLVAEGAYYAILSLLTLHAPHSCSSSVKSETLYGLINSLQKDLWEVLNDLHLVKLSRELAIREMINEMEFLKSILSCPSDGLIDRMKLKAIATHVDVLACEAGSAVNASAAELEGLNDQKTHTKVTSLVAKINQTKHELRQTNKKDEMVVHCLIQDFIKDEYFRTGTYSKSITLELDLYQTLFRCTEKWCIDHPRLRVIRIHTEDVVRCAGWDIRSLSFRKNIIGKKVTGEKIEFLLSDTVQKLTLHRPEVEEICTKIRDLKPSSPCRLSKIFGLVFADVKCKLIRNIEICKPESIFELSRHLQWIAGNLLIGSKSLNGLSIFLEDLIDRAACLSYLQLVNKADKTVSLKVLLDRIEEPLLVKRFEALLDCTVWNMINGLIVTNFALPRHVRMLVPVKTLQQFIQGCIDFDASGSKIIEEPLLVTSMKDQVLTDGSIVKFSAEPYHVGMLTPVNILIRLLEGNVVTSMKDHVGADATVAAFIKDHIETVLRDLTVLRCILSDPLIEYYEQQEFDELLTDIGAGIIEAGLFFFFMVVPQSKENIFFGVKDVAWCLSATVKQVYFKYTKLSLSKLPTTEMGSLNNLLANLKKIMNKCRQIRELHEDLQVCNSFLEDSDILSNQDELGMINCLRTRILHVGCKLANTLVTFEEVPDWFFVMRISSFTEGVKVITEDVKDVTLRLLAEVDSSNQMNPKVEAKPLLSKVIGFVDEEEQLSRQLTTGSPLLKVISIVGMPGLGKTTLAMKVYEAVAGSFHCSAWCYVSQNYEKKGLLLQILNEIEGSSEGIKELSYEDLASKLNQCLKKKKNYLIVLDDVWDIKTWNELRMCFPRGKDGNRILLTSRSKVVGSHAFSSDDSCMSLNLLSTKNSRLLLESTIFGARGFPEHLREIGTKIADRCGQLPLSLVLVAGVLKNTDENKEEWQQVAENLNSLVQSQEGVSNTLELSYKHLPDQLKQCFLYCGALMSRLLRGEIRSSKLVQLWVAERFIDETNEHRSLDLEEAAECCLMDLISRSLLIVSKIATDGQIHSCRIHDLLRDFCIWKGNGEQFLLTRLDVSKPFPNWQKRLSICFGMLSKVISPWSRVRTRSVIHSECDIVCLRQNHSRVSHVLDAFPLLNVLDLEGAIMGDNFPESIIKMRKLRYLAVGGLMNCIPSSIDKLLDLETVIIKGGKDAVRIPDTVFGLKKLRHLNVRPHIHFTTTSLSPSDCLELRTLAIVIICHCEVCKDAINRLPNLRKLNCIFSGSIRYDGFPALDYLSCLESIKASYSGLSPLFFKFSFPILPKSLKKITLSKFELPWSEMENIAALPHVEYLKLQNGAFSGKNWVTQYEFPSLKYLRLDSLDVEEWEASDDHFPCLEQLIVRGCKRLKEIPPEFSDVVTLSFIEINQCGRSVGDSAVEIEKQQKDSGNAQFKAVLYSIEKMAFNEEQANKELYLSWGVFLAFQFVLFMSMGIRSSH